MFWFTEHIADAQIHCSDPLKEAGFEHCSCSCNILSRCNNLIYFNHFLSTRKDDVGSGLSFDTACFRKITIRTHESVKSILELKKLRTIPWTSVYFGSFQDAKKFAINKTTVFNQLRKPNKSKALAISSSISYSQCFFSSKYSARPFH